MGPKAQNPFLKSSQTGSGERNNAMGLERALSPTPSESVRNHVPEKKSNGQLYSYPEHVLIWKLLAFPMWPLSFKGKQRVALGKRSSANQHIYKKNGKYNHLLLHSAT